MTPNADLSGKRDWFFDCDGVLLDSNGVKTRAFEEVAMPYGQAAADALVAFHRANGGVSRFVKWHHFFSEILCRAPAAGEYEHIIQEFARRSRQGVLEAAPDPSLRSLVTLLRTAGNRCHVVSGAAEDELREVLSARGIAELFHSVNGSPATKIEIIDSLHSGGRSGGVFVGDSALDHEVAVARGLAFVFVAHWSDYDGWAEALASTDAVVVEDLSQLCARLSTAQLL